MGYTEKQYDTGPHSPPPTVTGVGVGPGDPEQVTLAAIRAISQAHRVVAPSSSVEAVGRAESVVRQVCPGTAINRVVIAMDGSPGTTDAYAGAARTMCSWLDAGQSVAFVTLGDPNLYSTFSSMREALYQLRPETPFRTIPGITAFQTLAATTGTVLTTGTQPMTVVTALDDFSDLRAALADPERAIVVYKGGRRFPQIAKLVADAGRLDGAFAGELLGLPGQRTVPLRDVAETPSAYLSTIIIPAAKNTLALSNDAVDSNTATFSP